MWLFTLPLSGVESINGNSVRLFVCLSSLLTWKTRSQGWVFFRGEFLTGGSYILGVNIFSGEYFQGWIFYIKNFPPKFSICSSLLLGSSYVSTWHFLSGGAADGGDRSVERNCHKFAWGLWRQHWNGGKYIFSLFCVLFSMFQLCVLKVNMHMEDQGGGEDPPVVVPPQEGEEEVFWKQMTNIIVLNN